MQDAPEATIGGTSAVSALIAARATEILASMRVSMQELRSELIAESRKNGTRIEHVECR